MFRLDRNWIARARALFDRWRPSEPPVDPLTAVREPKWRNPGGRSSGIAVAEPEPDEFVTATGGRHNQP